MKDWIKPLITEMDINNTLEEAGGGNDYNGGTKSTAS